MAIVQEFDLNMIPDSAPVIVHVNQYDEGEGRFEIHLYDGNVPYVPAAGAEAIIQGTKPDGKGFDYTATLSGSTVTADVTKQMTAVAGVVRVQVVITEGDNVTGTFVFGMDVQRSGLPADTDMSASDYSYVMQLIETAQAINDNPPRIGENGNWWVWDTSTQAYVDSGVDASITVAIADITMLEPSATPYVSNTGTNTDPIFHLFIPRGKGISSITKTSTQGLVDTYTITYSDDTTTTFTVTNGKSAYQSAVEGGYDWTEAEFNQELADFKDYADGAAQSAEDSEAWATGMRDGSAVPSTDPTYHNNAKYYSEEADGSAEDAEAWAVGERDGVPVPSTDPTYHNNAKYWSDQAAGKTLAGLSDTDIDESTLDDGQLLAYNGTSEKWENADLADMAIDSITDSIATYPEPTAGETLKIIFGKIKKFLSDLKGNKTDLTNLATVEPTATASKSYSVDDWLILNGQLYKVTAPIPIGGTITIGTNAEPTTVEDGKSSGGGHTILNASGITMTTEEKLQFSSKVVDDNVNGKTIVYSGSEEVVTVLHTSWTTQNTTIDGTVYPYKKAITLTKPIYGSPVIDRVATVGGSTTDAQITAFNCLAYVGHDPDYPTTLNLYASSVPAVDFSILVRWEGGEA